MKLRSWNDERALTDEFTVEVTAGIHDDDKQALLLVLLVVSRVPNIVDAKEANGNGRVRIPIRKLVISRFQYLAPSLISSFLVQLLLAGMAHKSNLSPDPIRSSQREIHFVWDVGRVRVSQELYAKA